MIIASVQQDIFKRGSAIFCSRALMLMDHKPLGNWKKMTVDLKLVLNHHQPSNPTIPLRRGSLNSHPPPTAAHLDSRSEKGLLWLEASGTRAM